jgi:hypothetical protein
VIEYIVGAAATATGQITAAIIRRLRGPKKYKPAKQPKPICGCTHHYSSHGKDGKCRVTVRVLVERGQPRTMQTGYQGSRHELVYELERWEQNNCACQRYTGPEPMPEMIAL